MAGLWRILARYAIGRLAPGGMVSLDVDDTLFHKSGPAIAGVGVFRDAVRSTTRRVVYALGLNPVTLLDRTDRGVHRVNHPEPIHQFGHRHQPRVVGQRGIRRADTHPPLPTTPTTTPYPAHQMGVLS